MENKHSRKPSKKISIPLSISSTSSGSGISPKTVVKGKAAAESTTGEQGTVGAGGNKPKTSATLGFRSWKTGTLPNTVAFQPPGCILKKTQSISMSNGLSAKSPTLVPAATSKNDIKKSVARPSSASQTPGIPCHKPEPATGPTKVPDVILQMQELPAFNATRHSKHLRDVSTARSSVSAASVVTSQTMTSPFPVKICESIVRVDPKKKDFVISATGIIRNRFHVDELELADGIYIYRPNSPFDPTNVLGEIATKDEAGKEQFWLNHHVQIIVDLRRNLGAVVTEDKSNVKGKSVAVDVKREDKEVIATTVIDQMASLGNDFYNYATCITVDLIFPPPPEGSVAIRTYGQRDPCKKHIGANFNTVVNTIGFKTLQQLAAKLDNCSSMAFLEVVIHNPNSSNSQPFTVEQLMYALPFYDLHYEEWRVKWQGSYMTHAVDVGRFPITLIDKERNKWLWAIQHAEKQAQIRTRKEQARIDSMVFVRQSVAPEWQKTTWLPQTFPPAPKSASADD